MSTHRNQDWWDRYFMEMAKHIASASKDPSTQVGAVIIDSNRAPLSWGYNGLAQRVLDTPERLNNRELKYKLVQHAERNSIVFARKDLRGGTIYTYPFMPCASCAGMIIQAGIIEVVAPRNDNPRWQEDFKLATEQFFEADVDLRLLDM